MLLNEKKKKKTKRRVLIAAVILIVLIIGANTGNNLKYAEMENTNINNRFTINVPGKLNEKEVGIPDGYEFIKEHKIFTIEKHDISVRVCYTLYNNNVQLNLSSLYDMTNRFASNSNVIKNYEATEKEIVISGKQALRITASLDMNNRPAYLDSLYIIDKPYMYEITVIYSRNNNNAIKIAKDIIQSIKLN